MSYDNDNYKLVNVAFIIVFCIFGLAVRVWENWGKSDLQTRKVIKWLKNPNFSTDSPPFMQKMWQNG